MLVHAFSSLSSSFHSLSSTSAAGSVQNASLPQNTFRQVTRYIALLSLMLFTAFLVGCDGEVDIVHGLNELEANEILVVLDSEGINSHKIPEEGRVITWAIVVNNSTKGEAMALLVANKLPRKRVMGLAEVYPPGSGGLIPTKSEEKAKFLMALQGEIERKLLGIPGVLKAHVSVVIPAKEVVRDINAKPPEATAAVALVYNPDANGDLPITQEQVALLTSASIEALKPERVTVLLKKNMPLSLASARAANAGPRPKSVMGIKVVDQKAAAKAKMILLVSIALAGLGLLLGLGGIARSLTLRSKLGKAEAKVTSLEKARIS